MTLDELVLDCATWLPPDREKAIDAIADGRLTEVEAEELGVTAVPISHRLAAPEMAVRAAERVLEATRCEPSRVGLLAHGWIYHQGHDFWSPAHYVARGAGAVHALPVGVQQMSNSGAAALGIAVDRLCADPAAQAALVTTADRFTLPGFDRWSADYGVAYGDAGTALLLRRRGEGGHHGSLAPRSLAFVTDASFEEMYRGRDAFSEIPLGHSGRVDARRPKKAYLEIHGGVDHFARTAAACVERVLCQALAEAGLETGDRRITKIALPRLGDAVLDLMYRPVLDGLVPAAEVLHLYESSGHLGAGDLAANLEHLAASGLRPGELAVVLGGGGGFTWSCVVVEAL